MKDLLLLLCNYPHDPANREAISNQLNGITDWPGFIQLVNSHGITALSYYNIKEAGLEKAIPPDALAFLEKGYLQSVARNSWLTEKWKEVNRILSEAGIKHILLKGMALEHSLYGSRGLRQMNDNDILLRREDALKAWLLLQDKGFIAKPLKSPLHKKILPDLGKHLPELYKEGYSLEIHTRLFDETKYDEDFYNDIFNNAAEIKTDNIPALALPHDININYLIKHFNYHRQAGDCQLRLYNDIRLLHPVNKPEFPGEFILNPVQKGSKKFIREIYKTGFKSVPAHYRLRYLTGDIFPSLWWMKERYKCGTMAALLRYPARLGKLWWIV